RARDLSTLAGRFDSALNNMPSGLAMLDSSGRIVVTNRKLRDLLKLPAGADAAAFRSVRDLFAGCAASGVVEATRAEAAAAGLEARIRDSAAGELQLELNGGRILNLAAQPMANGGAVVMFEDVTERNLAQARINELARFDPLTGLPNRTEFRERAAALLAGKQDEADAAILFVDLDQFKQVNDTLGQSVGDLLLCAVAERLERAARPHDAVARLGGDEFVVFVDPIRSIAEIETIARAIIANLAAPFEIAGNHLRVGASIGIARALDVGTDLDTLLKSADLALYQAKADGRGVWRFFEPSMEQKAQARRDLEFDLRLALETDQLDVAFQPIFNVTQHEYLGCEALLRWRHPTRGPISPAVFIPIAEEIGLVCKLDEWILRRACRAAMQWPDDIKVAVNFSAVHFQRTEIISMISSALAESGLSPQRLEVELTESAFLQNMQLTRAILNELRRIGVRISLDDFGTGYSSLSYLHSLPLNKIKIDRSFLNGLERDPRARRLLTGVARLSKDLGLAILMEGVETEDQLNLVTSTKLVDEIQGFYFSRPIPGADITELFAKARRSAA
ncbi:MAG: putative bifunctional diguanylate cyclase/phosphodiesterase, partial [Roseiarcus sp.]